MTALTESPLAVSEAEAHVGTAPIPGVAPAVSSIFSATVMIVDDEPVNLLVVTKYLSDCGYDRFLTHTDPVEALEALQRETPDLILLDVRMPKISGLEMLDRIRHDPRLRRTPVIIVTKQQDKDTRRDALRRGATDFLGKPFDPSELVLRARNTLLVKMHQNDLEAQVRQRTEELAASRVEVIHCLARAAESRDNDTGNHVLRVGRYAAILAQEVGYPEEDLQTLELASVLHDIGKLGISDSILLKPGKLDPGEMEVMNLHCAYGAQILRSGHATHCFPGYREGELSTLAKFESPILRLAAVVAESHHERWDGQGYPNRLSGEDIPIEGRITAIADVYDALSTARPYKSAFDVEKCFAILADGRGTQFDPVLIDAFFRITEKILAAQQEYADH